MDSILQDLEKCRINSIKKDVAEVPQNIINKCIRQIKEAKDLGWSSTEFIIDREYADGVEYLLMDVAEISYTRNRDSFDLEWDKNANFTFC